MAQNYPVTARPDSEVADLLARLGIGGNQRAMHAGAFDSRGWRQNSDAAATPIESRSPASGQWLGTVRGASDADYAAVLDSAVTLAKDWRLVPSPRRGELVRLLGEALRQHKQDLGRLVALENGKILAEGLGEVQEMIDIADFAVGQSRMMYGLAMHSERVQHRMMEQWHPLGLVGVISAFNFPVAVWAWNAFLAAICGNVSVWKPSPKTPLCALAVQHLCDRVAQQHGFPAVFQLFVTADNNLAERFVADRRVALVSFTGSTAVGRRVATAVAARLGKSLLELGGNNALIVDASADMKLALPAIVFGAVGTAGQRCTSTRRVLVHRSRSAELRQRLVAAYSQVRIGDPLHSETLMGPLIDPAAVQRYLDAIATARAAGGELLCGGEQLGGQFVTPAIINAHNEWPIVQQETFGPLLYLIEVDSLQAAIAAQNHSEHGLSAALFTEQLRASELYLSAAGSDCGIANINLGTSGAEIGGAFGGEKDTGGGRESGSDAWKAYMRRQTNTINGSSAMPLAQGIRFDL